MQIKQLSTKTIATALGILGVSAQLQAQNVVANDDTIVTNVTRGSIPITTLLNNDTETNGAPLFILNVGTPQFGTAVLSRDRNNVTFVSYTPNRSFAGIDSFTYRISDSQNGLGSSSTATITLLNPFLSGRGIYATSLSGAGGSHDVSGFFNICHKCRHVNLACARQSYACNRLLLCRRQFEEFYNRYAKNPSGKPGRGEI